MELKALLQEMIDKKASTMTTTSPSPCRAWGASV